MFIQQDELTSAIYAYTLGHIQADPAMIRSAILAAIQEASSYLNGKYDTQAIFNAQGDDRNILVLEHCKTIAVWYILRPSNADMIYDKARDYYTQAIDWFKLVAGVGESGRSIAPDLPPKKADGQVLTKMRYGSNRKFRHNFDD